jgi:hypothetical protein
MTVPFDAKVWLTLLQIVLGCSPDDTGQHVPRLQGESHNRRSRPAGNSSIRPATARVNRPNRAWISRAQVQSRRTIADRLNIFTIRGACARLLRP